MEVRRFTAFVCAGVLVSLWMSGPAQAQARKLTRDEQNQAQALVAIVDDAIIAQGGGQATAPSSDVALTFRADFMKSEGTMVYAPYTVAIEPGKFSSFPVAMTIRVIKQGEEKDLALKLETAKKESKQSVSVSLSEEGGFSGLSSSGGTQSKRPVYAFEDYYFFPNPKDGRIQRAFSVPAGDYEVYIAMREKPGKGQPKTTVMHQPLSVPDMTQGLQTSSVIVASAVEPSKEQLSGEKQLAQPYTVGGMKITPAASTKMPKSGEISVLFFVYNPGLTAAKKPDVEVNYTFYMKQGTGEKMFNRTKPQPFNEATLPPEFNAGAGHQIMAGQAVPLASFPEGDYRLEIKVTDKTNSNSITKNVSFSVGS
jgi:hypothetical protein